MWAPWPTATAPRPLLPCSPRAAQPSHSPGPFQPCPAPFSCHPRVQGHCCLQRALPWEGRAWQGRAGAHRELRGAVQHTARALTLLIYLSLLLRLQACPALATSHFPCFSWDIMPQPISSWGKKSFLSFRPNMPFLYFIPLLWVISNLLHSFCLSPQQLLHSWARTLLPFPTWLVSQLHVFFNAKLHLFYLFMWTFLICDFFFPEFFFFPEVPSNEVSRKELPSIPDQSLEPLWKSQKSLPILRGGLHVSILKIYKSFEAVSFPVCSPSISIWSITCFIDRLLSECQVHFCLILY